MLAMSTPTKKIPSVLLNNGYRIPVLGLGFFRAKANGEAEKACRTALEVGYRHLDTATHYENEQDVGAAIKLSRIQRGEIFVTSKVWNTDHGREKTLHAFKNSIAK